LLEVPIIASCGHSISEDRLHKLLMLSHWHDLDTISNCVITDIYYARQVSTTHNGAKGHDIQSISRPVSAKKPFCSLLFEIMFAIISKFVPELTPLPSTTNNHKPQFSVDNTLYGSSVDLSFRNGALGSQNTSER